MLLLGVCIETNDVLKLKNFYENLFETQSSGDEVHCEFKYQKLAIYNLKLGEGRELEETRNNIVIMYEVKDVDTLYKRLLESEVKILKKPTIKRWGVKVCTIEDPDGNKINLLMPLSKNISTLTKSELNIEYTKFCNKYEIVWGNSEFSITDDEVNQIMNEFFKDNYNWYMLGSSETDPIDGGLGQYINMTFKRLTPRHASAIAAILYNESLIDYKGSKPVLLRKCINNYVM